MKYVYIVFEQHSGTNIGVCTSMEDAIAYTSKLQKQADKRADQTTTEQYSWYQLPLINDKDIPCFKGNIGFKRTGGYSLLEGWKLDPLGLVADDSRELLVDYTDNLPDVQFEIGRFGNVEFTVVSSVYVPENEILDFVKQKYEEWVK